MNEQELARKQIAYSEDRLSYHYRMMQERPRLARIYEYWFHYFAERRRSWLTRLWLSELKEWKREVRALLPLLPVEEQARTAEITRKNVKTVEDSLAFLLTEETQTENLARERNWRIRFPVPHRTLVSWIAAKRRRIARIRYWIEEILAELPALWKNFVYVIYYSYTSPGQERHLEAHLEGQCHVSKKVQEQVKKLANHLLRLWVANPISTKGGATKLGYAVPLLTSGMEKPPYEGVKTSGASRWEWGIQYEAILTPEHTLTKSEPKTETKETQTIRCEIYDYDYGRVRMEEFFNVPAVFWALSIEKLERIFKVGQYVEEER